MHRTPHTIHRLGCPIPARLPPTTVLLPWLPTELLPGLDQPRPACLALPGCYIPAYPPTYVHTHPHTHTHTHTYIPSSRRPYVPTFQRPLQPAARTPPLPSLLPPAGTRYLIRASWPTSSCPFGSVRQSPASPPDPCQRRACAPVPCLDRRESVAATACRPHSTPNDGRQAGSSLLGRRPPTMAGRPIGSRKFNGTGLSA